MIYDFSGKRDNFRPGLVKKGKIVYNKEDW